jgi:Alpha amylase, catalytic domain
VPLREGRTERGDAISIWPRYPTLYEINTWAWLSELSLKTGMSVDLGKVPLDEWNALAKLGFDAVWLMGVWERSPIGIAIANQNAHLVDEFRRTLPDFRPEDNVGSPYCIRRYVVDTHLGGPAGLAIARRELAKRGMKLLLDFVPNHIAPDHPWVAEHPEYLVRGNVEDVRIDPASYLEIRGTVYARGRDPHFPAWPDVLQLDAFRPELRRAAIETVSNIAAQCDGVRCDMAMLVMNLVFERTWGSRAAQPPSTEYWNDVISVVKKANPYFCFVAEAYWGLEWDLQQQGFDFCYDKRLYDRLEYDNAESIRLHLCADLAYQDKLLRFLENHDEPRAAATFSSAKQRALAVATSTLPGIRLFHEGQLEGFKVKLPVFLGRRPVEPVDEALQAFYERLLAAINAPIFRDGEWRLCERSGWAVNRSFQNLVAWSWIKENDRLLIVINLSDNAVQARVQLPWEELRATIWNLIDVLSAASYDRDGDELASSGLYVELEPWSYHFFRCHRAGRD